MPSGIGLQLALGVLAALVLGGALLVVTIRNLFRAALSLGVVLLGVAGLFVLLEADFLAFVQVLVYVGAILVLVVFAVMLTARSHSVAEPQSRQRLPAALVCLTLFVALGAVTEAIIPATELPPAVTLTQLGEELITSLVLPFEVISLVFVAALVGAIALASSSTPKKHFSK